MIAAIRGMSPASKAISFMIATIFLFSVMDVIAKSLSSSYDTFQVVWARYASQVVLAFVLLAPRLNTLMRTRYIKMQLLRSAFLFAATMMFFNGIFLVGLAKSAAIMSANPLIITIVAMVVLGEAVGRRRLIAVSLGFIGTLIIIRPGTDVFTWQALLPLGAAFCYSGYAISTKFLGQEESPWTSFLYTALIGGVAASCIVPWYWTTPTLTDAVWMLAMGGFGAVGHYFLIRAFMLADASLVAPFAYVGIIFAAIWGMIVFAEFPDAFTYLGALVIVSAGLYVWHRETRINTNG